MTQAIPDSHFISKKGVPRYAGTHVLFEMMGSKHLDDGERIQTAMKQAIHATDASLVDFMSKKFEPQGYTGIALLEESHFSVHTWPTPTGGTATFDCYTCGTSNPNKAIPVLFHELVPDIVYSREFLRGAHELSNKSHVSETWIEGQNGVADLYLNATALISDEKLASYSINETKEGNSIELTMFNHRKKENEEEVRLAFTEQTPFRKIVMYIEPQNSERKFSEKGEYLVPKQSIVIERDAKTDRITISQNNIEIPTLPLTLDLEAESSPNLAMMEALMQCIQCCKMEVQSRTKAGMRVSECKSNSSNKALP